MLLPSPLGHLVMKVVHAPILSPRPSGLPSSSCRLVMKVVHALTLPPRPPCDEGSACPTLPPRPPCDEGSTCSYPSPSAPGDEGSACPYPAKGHHVPLHRMPYRRVFHVVQQSATCRAAECCMPCSRVLHE